MNPIFKKDAQNDDNLLNDARACKFFFTGLTHRVLPDPTQASRPDARLICLAHASGAGASFGALWMTMI
jgi:hypothetical protein